MLITIVSIPGCGPDDNDPAVDTVGEIDTPPPPPPEDVSIPTPDTEPTADSVTPLGECTQNEECADKLDPSPCEKTVCNIALEKCVLTSANDGDPCSDDNLCTTETLCSGGICVIAGSDALLNCNDDNSCTSNNCDPEDGCFFLPLSGGPCDDGEVCTQNEHCDQGVCTGGKDICPAQCGNGTCQTTKGESCSTCPLDCGACSTGCNSSLFPGCDGCGCESCVCLLQPECCSEPWSEDCTELCAESCGQSCDGCDPTPLPGCGECTCESCVCEQKPACCEEAWTTDCAALCAATCESECSNPCGNGQCDAIVGESCSTCPGDCGACSDGCTPTLGPGCDGCACESCVCENDPSCCQQQWTEECTSLCDNCGQSCSGCGQAPNVPSCHGCSCQACVCEAQPFCCDIGWDSSCVTLCESCGSNCSGCNPSAEPGCAGCACESCVCDLIPSCCNEGWSSLCVTACTSECGSDCPGP